MVLLHFTADEFLRLGLELVGFTDQRQERTQRSTNVQRFRSSFGTYPEICSVIFDDFQTTAIADARIAKPSYHFFLITLNWLTTYKKEKELARWGDEKSIRTHVRTYLFALQAFKANKIVWRDLSTAPEIFVLTVDGVHCRISEPRTEPDHRWKSYKLNKPGVAYELGISIWNSQLVWVNGPFKGGMKDLLIFREPNGLKSKIPAGKKILADSGYPGEHSKVSLRRHTDTPAVYNFKNRALARHESFNSSIKKFKALEERFRHRGPKNGPRGINFHKAVFEAVCVIVQYEMDNGHPLFDV